ncbi:MAG: C4-type zinc ribbon domain-containing protein [Desulfovibrionales bacterium]|nr:C4-type zinc ribbon domain-containing protein [Desulfovibrionales bacterium]
MSLYLKQIEQLVALQLVDDEILGITSELDEAPKEVEALQERFDALETQRNRFLEKIEHLKAQEKRINSEIESDSLKVKKSKSKLMLVGNTKEYHAMMREMDNLEKLNRLREEEKFALAEELERQQMAVNDMEERYSLIKDELDEKKESLKERVAEANKVLEKLDKKRIEAGKEVPEPVLNRYEFIRSRLENPVIVAVKEQICNGCHIAIPPQSYIELQKGQQILSCPNCQRLIYWSEHFSTDEDQAAEA